MKRFINHDKYTSTTLLSTNESYETTLSFQIHWIAEERHPILQMGTDGRLSKTCDALDLLSTLQIIVHSHGDEAAIQKQVSAVITTTDRRGNRKIHFGFNEGKRTYALNGGIDWTDRNTKHTVHGLFNAWKPSAELFGLLDDFFRGHAGFFNCSVTNDLKTTPTTSDDENQMIAPKAIEMFPGIQDAIVNGVFTGQHEQAAHSLAATDMGKVFMTGGPASGKSTFATRVVRLAAEQRE
ncbi:hypothetical protein CFAM422_008956 [Trichoderma lentiforme]|uniref:Uncharacterized protein n=1 Tax=Trichoderma lentiforme TaxID=1567552 RepID=A0A9P5C9Q4_9HYPO|nr:hypothetical protein CFAM422_008956 [Trichoderma lentiforme]